MNISVLFSVKVAVDFPVASFEHVRVKFRVIFCDKSCNCSCELWSWMLRHVDGVPGGAWEWAGGVW